MGWNVDVTGTKAAVKRAVAERLDKAAEFACADEASDIVYAKGKILAAVDASQCEGALNGLVVKACGSQIWDTGVVCSANLNLTVQRCALAL